MEGEGSGGRRQNLVEGGDMMLGMGGGEITGLCRLWRRPPGREAAPSGENKLFAHGLGRW
jgi:hypothetical protein